MSVREAQTTSTRISDLVGLCLAAFLGSAGLSLAAGYADQCIVEWALLGSFALVGIGLSIVDIQQHRLPDLVTLPLAAGILGATIVLTFQAGDLLSGVSAIAAAAGVVVILFFLGVFGGLGLGDVKLGASIGLLLGWHAWHLPLLAVAVAPVLAAPHAIILLVARRRGRSNDGHLPFGPYLIAGTVLLGVLTFLA